MTDNSLQAPKDTPPFYNRFNIYGLGLVFSCTLFCCGYIAHLSILWLPQDRGGGHLKNASPKIYELVKLQRCTKIVPFNVWVKYFIISKLRLKPMPNYNDELLHSRYCAEW